MFLNTTHWPMRFTCTSRLKLTRGPPFVVAAVPGICCGCGGIFPQYIRIFLKYLLILYAFAGITLNCELGESISSSCSGHFQSLILSCRHLELTLLFLLWQSHLFQIWGFSFFYIRVGIRCKVEIEKKEEKQRQVSTSNLVHNADI